MYLGLYRDSASPGYCQRLQDWFSGVWGGIKAIGNSLTRSGWKIYPTFSVKLAREHPGKAMMWFLIVRQLRVSWPIVNTTTCSSSLWCPPSSPSPCCSGGSTPGFSRGLPAASRASPTSPDPSSKSAVSGRWWSLKMCLLIAGSRLQHYILVKSRKKPFLALQKLNFLHFRFFLMKFQMAQFQVKPVSCYIRFYFC